MAFEPMQLQYSFGTHAPGGAHALRNHGAKSAAVVYTRELMEQVQALCGAELIYRVAT